MEQPQEARTYHRSYVATKETYSYVLYDAAQKFGLDGSLFNTDILKMNLRRSAFIGFVTGIWDVINDPITAILVDKTRTRWGKFKVYLVVGAILGLLSGLLYWNAPLFVNCTNEYDNFKFGFFFIRSLINETYGTFSGLAIHGFTMSLSPNPLERTKLLAKARVWSSFFDFLPGLLSNLFYDLSVNGLIALPLKKYYMILGSAYTLIQSLFTLFFFVQGKERVPQTVKTPSVMDGLRAVFRYRPVRLYMLSELLGTVGRVKLGYGYYYSYVLGIRSFDTLKDIPTAVYAAVSYAWVDRAKAKLPSNWLWLISSDNVDYVILLINYLFGCIGGRGKNGWYQSPVKMWIVMMLMEFPRKTTWGMRNVIPDEIKYEMIDYCEWQIGFRSEGMIINAIGLVTKLSGNLFGSVQNLLLERIGFDLRKDHLGQSDKTKFGIFTLAYLFPFLTGSFSAIPKLLYQFNKEEKAQMYRELKERRDALAEETRQAAAAEGL